MSAVAPYGNFRFRVSYGGRRVAGFALARATDDRSALTLERGVTEDPDFGRWLADSARLGSASDRIDLAVEVFNEAGDPITTHRLQRCRAADCRSMPYMDGAPRVAVRLLRLECEDWQEG